MCYLPDLLAASWSALCTIKYCHEWLSSALMNRVTDMRPTWSATILRVSAHLRRAGTYSRGEDATEEYEDGVHAEQRRIDIVVLGVKTDIGLCTGGLRCQQYGGWSSPRLTATMNSFRKAFAWGQRRRPGQGPDTHRKDCR